MNNLTETLDKIVSQNQLEMTSKLKSMGLLNKPIFNLQVGMLQPVKTCNQVKVNNNKSNYFCNIK